MKTPFFLFTFLIIFSGANIKAKSDTDSILMHKFASFFNENKAEELTNWMAVYHTRPIPKEFFSEYILKLKSTYGNIQVDSFKVNKKVATSSNYGEYTSYDIKLINCFNGQKGEYNLSFFKLKDDKEFGLQNFYYSPQKEVYHSFVDSISLYELNLIFSNKTDSIYYRLPKETRNKITFEKFQKISKIFKQINLEKGHSQYSHSFGITYTTGISLSTKHKVETIEGKEMLVKLTYAEVNGIWTFIKFGYGSIE